MPHKKKTGKKKTAPQTVLRAEEETLVNELLEYSQDMDPSQMLARIPDSRIAQGLIDRLPLDENTPISLLTAIKEKFEQKEVRKAVKRSLYRLKSQGLFNEAVPNETRRSPSILKPAQKKEPEAYIGPLDLKGSRAVFIILHRALKGQDVGLGIVSDEAGMQQFHYGVFSKNRTRELKAYFAQEAGPLVNTSLSHAATVLEAAYRRHLELNPDVPQDYLEIRPWLLEQSSVLSRPAIYDTASCSESSDGVLTDSQLERLFAHELMQSWFIELERLRPCMEEILQIDDSPIVLTEPQKIDRLRHIKEKRIEGLFPPEKRTLLQHRFDEMAYMFYKLGQEDFCRLCLAAAHSLTQKDTILKINPVIAFLMDRSLDFYMNTPEETDVQETPEDDRISRIVLP
ncbi:MAG: hypothetical protein R6V46_02860 [Desulfatiglandaceae bacterium]